MKLKHLLLRHMYNSSLPNLCATLLIGPLCPVHLIVRVIVSTLHCAVPYIAACVDVSGTVLSGPFTTGLLIGVLERDVLILVHTRTQYRLHKLCSDLAVVHQKSNQMEKHQLY